VLAILRRFDINLLEPEASDTSQERASDAD